MHARDKRETTIHKSIILYACHSTGLHVPIKGHKESSQNLTGMYNGSPKDGLVRGREGGREGGRGVGMWNLWD